MSGEAAVRAVIGFGRFSEAVVEIGGDVFDADDAAVTAVPRCVVASAVGHPQDSGLDDVYVTQAEPKVALLGETDGAPRRLRARACGYHHEVFKTVTGRIVGDIGRFAGNQRDLTQVFEFRALF